VSDESGDEVLEARRVRIRPWQYVLVGLAVVAVGGVQVVRHGPHRPHPGSARTTVAVAAPTPRVITGPALLSSVVGNRCPTSVICGVGQHVSAGMAAEFRRDFPGAVITLQASAFDAGMPRTYWQQISATTSRGASVVLTEQRVRQPVAPRPLTVHSSPDGAAVSVSQTRANWLLIANLTGTGRSAVPVSAARRWVAETPLPR
jgi:hypothetical protein